MFVFNHIVCVFHWAERKKGFFGQTECSFAELHNQICSALEPFSTGHMTERVRQKREGEQTRRENRFRRATYRD